jgi:hypothetical protein
MSSVVTRYRQYAADCVRQAQGEQASEDRTILLNVALAWLRLAQQTEHRADATSPPTAPEHVDEDAQGEQVQQHELHF